MEYEDVIQLYKSTIISYEGEPLYVAECEKEQLVTRTLASNGREYKLIPVNTDKIKSVGRIGYINDGGIAKFVKRFPKRLFTVGVNANNLNVSGGLRLPPLFSKCIHDALFNNYPTLFAAWKVVKNNEAVSVAFDKQFAIDITRTIYYKGRAVGHIPKGYVRKQNIVWFKGFEYCEFLLDMNYEKTVPMA